MKRVARELIMTAIACSLTSAGFAQYVPARMQGEWKIRKLLEPEGGRGISCGIGAGPDPMSSKDFIDKTVTLEEHSGVLQDQPAENLSPSLSTLDIIDFTAKYIPGQSARSYLGIRADKVEVLTTGTAGYFPFNAVIVKDPTTLLFERCGFFYEATHSGNSERQSSRNTRR